VRQALIFLALIACGGEVEPTAPAPAPDPAPAPAQTAPAPAPAPAQTAPAPTPPDGVTTATRDGAPLYTKMCTSTDGDALKAWGEITDPKFEVDEGIIALDVTPSAARGKMTCGSDVKVVFAEARGAEFVADPHACDVTLATNAYGQLAGQVKAEYVDGDGARHTFTVDFTANACE